MKIAIISPWTVSPNAIGGTERFIIDLSQSLSELNNDVDVYMLSGKNYKQGNINFINIDILHNDEAMDEEKLIANFGDFSCEKTYELLAQKLEQLIDAEQYDLIHLNSQLFLKAWKNKNRVFTIHTNPFEYELNFGKNGFECMIKLMKKENTNGKTYFVTPSFYYSEEYKRLTNINVSVIPHAIDVKRLFCNKSRDRICEELKLDTKLHKILLPSRLEPVQKQPMLFLKAFSNLSYKIKSNYEVICTGLDKQYEKYADEIISFCKNNNINLKIMRFPTMSQAYKISDLVVLPSKSESFGYSALESLSLGIVTIINSIPTYLEIAEGSLNAYTFDKDEKSLNLVLKNVLNSSLKRKKQYSSWHERYNLENFGNRYLEILKRKYKNSSKEIQRYKPYDNMNEYKIVKDGPKTFFKFNDLMLEVYSEETMPKAGLLFDNVLKKECRNSRVLDLGCGYLGIVGLMSLYYGARSVMSVDVDQVCIDWFKKIIRDNNIGNVRAINSNLFEKIPKNQKFDLILSNPPHMPMMSGKLCDFGGTDGRYFISKILREGYNYLNENGKIYMMMFDFLGVDESFNEGISICELAKGLGYRSIEIVSQTRKIIQPGSVTFESLDYIKRVYPKYRFDDVKPECKIYIVRFQK